MIFWEGSARKNGGQTLKAKTQLADEPGARVKHASREARPEIPLSVQNLFPTKRSTASWHTRHSYFAVQCGYFCQWVFLAWSQGLPPFKTPVHEEKILVGQNSGKQKARRAGPPGPAKRGVEGADGVGMPRWQRC